MPAAILALTVDLVWLERWLVVCQQTHRRDVTSDQRVDRRRLPAIFDWERRVSER